jgi:hypothetical protein
MSVGPLGNTQALSGASQEAASQARRAASDQRAELAAGLGEMDADQETADRDADGRRPWEFPRKDRPGEPEEAQSVSTDAPPAQSKDASGQCGGTLDLLG